MTCHPRTASVFPTLDRYLRRWLRATATAAIAVLALHGAAPRHAVIPASERAALQALYTSTNGAAWANSANWNGAVGTECTWFGVTCSAGNANVTQIDLTSNNLSGPLPSLAAFTALERFVVNNNTLSGSIPSLSGLSSLQFFLARNNSLTGSIPSLSGLSALRALDLSQNQLTGSIPSLAGLTQLQNLIVSNNALTGAVPALIGSPLLTIVNVGQNSLTGSLPALTGLTSLITFRANTNQLSGPIPALSGLSSMQEFSVQNNQLSGTIPSLAGLTALQDFQVYGNQLTGALPSLAGLASLGTFFAYNNQLSGNIPALAGLAELDEFDVSNNQLSGSIPSLAGLNDLDVFRVANNQLTGSIPAAPPGLDPGESALCPNFLTPSVNVAWDLATGSTPWSAQCTAATIFTVTPNAGANGTISPGAAQNVVQGGSVVFETIPNVGFVLSTVGVTGPCSLATTAPNQHLVSNVQGNCVFNSTYAAAPASFTVTPSVLGGNGSITPSTPQTVASGASIAFTLTPNPGYVLGGVQGSCQGSLNGNVFTTNPIVANCTLVALFALDRNAISASVPTLGPIGMAALALLVAMLGFLQRKRQSD